MRGDFCLVSGGRTLETTPPPAVRQYLSGLIGHRSSLVGDGGGFVEGGAGFQSEKRLVECEAGAAKNFSQEAGLYYVVKRNSGWRTEVMVQANVVAAGADLEISKVGRR